ncbi:Site-specific recombinase XerD [Granulicella pectinivorans]|uniref:Site-specific recombinase XerD n=1 Tax=Granulicella pectinivorans TaxID=474950 RepID=A0A1I6M4U1_9BACT|nr:site-specific integrase [Granulicella pectinivorans]SFS10757.1 Site-specific recombinase XerD [Granulicella pectinivorans]
MTNALTSLPTLKLSRERYQRGYLTTESRSSGPDVWTYRWREPSGNGQSVRRKRIIGTVQEYKTETAARKAVDALRLDINAEAVSTIPMTIREVVGHYVEKELCDGRGKTPRTRETYRQHLDDYILPRWGAERIGDVKAFRVEAWLEGLDKADGTKSKTKAVFSVVYQHALRYGWATRNPIREVRQSAKRRETPDILTPEEVGRLLSLLPDYARTMVVVAAVTGLRRGELVGLRWEDVDFENGKIQIRRSLVDQIAGEPKTETSKRPIPLEPALVHALQSWREKTPYIKPGDWVFASPYDLGAKPYWPSTVLQKVIQPAAREAGILKRIGWHTFRRTTATWLLANGETVKTAQELMRHASPAMTLGVYAQAIDNDKRVAQGRISSLLGLHSAKAELAISA